jgi:hypothetical protein
MLIRLNKVSTTHLEHGFNDYPYAASEVLVEWRRNWSRLCGRPAVTYFSGEGFIAEKTILLDHRYLIHAKLWCRRSHSTKRGIANVDLP